MLTDEELALVERARAVIAGVTPDDNHTVAAAAYDSAGRMYTGVNVYHFNGGPCAEPVAMGHAVASEGVQLPLTTMVAVIADGGGVVPPCGRCRQMLFDYYPEIRVIVHREDGLASTPIRELLPYAFDSRDEGQQVMYVDAGDLDAVRDGSKRTTIQAYNSAGPGPVRFFFVHDAASVTTVDAVVTQVITRPVVDLDDDDATRDGFADREALLAALTRHYSNLDASTMVDIVHFELVDGRR